MAEIYRPRPFYGAADAFTDMLLDPRERQAAISTTTGAAAPQQAAQTPQVTQETPVTPQSTMSALDVPPVRAPAGYRANPQIEETYARYFRPLTEGLGQEYGALGEAQETFRTGAGTTSPYDEAALQRAITRGGPDEEELAAARALVEAEYGGPTGLAPEALQSIRTGLEGPEGLQPRTQALRSKAGVQAILGEQYPALTRGQRREEAGRVLQEPGFQRSRTAYEQDLAQFYADLTAAEREATAFAGQRAAEEADVQARSRAYLTGREAATMADLERQTIARLAERQKAIEDFNAFTASGDLASLLGIPAVTGTREGGALMPGETLPIQNLINEVPELQRIGEGLRIRNAIAEKYKDIADVPLFNLGLSGHGRERLHFPDEWFQANKNRPDYQAIRNRALERQAELEAAFAPSTGKRGNVGSNINVNAPYADVLPLYFGEDFEPVQPQGYAEFQAGNIPSPQNLATEDQRFLLQNIDDLMNRAERSFAQDPYQAARVIFDVKNYLDKEHEKMASFKGELTKNQQEWKQTVKHARDKYKHQKYVKAAKIMNYIAAGPYAGYYKLLLGTPVGEHATEVEARQLEGVFGS